MSLTFLRPRDQKKRDSGDENEVSSISPPLRAHDPECSKGKYRFDMTKFKRTQTRLVGHFALYWPLWRASMQFQTRKALTAGSTVITAIQAAPIFWGNCLPPLPSPCHRGYESHFLSTVISCFSVHVNEANGSFVMHWPLSLACIQFKAKDALTAGSTVVIATQAAPTFCLLPPSHC